MAQEGAVYQRLDTNYPKAARTVDCCCGDAGSGRRTCWKTVGKGCAVFCGAYICLYLVLIQAIIYGYACMYCSAAKMQGYEYMAPAPNLIPNNTLLIEQDPARFTAVRAFQVCEGNQGRDSCVGASFGVYYRYWGPIWWTYVFQDNNMRELYIVRDRPLAVGGSHKIMRCDGLGDPYVYNVGNHFIMNKLRYLFGMQTSSTYNIWKGTSLAHSSLVALTNRVGSLSTNPQLLFKKPGAEEAFASARLNTRHYEHKWDEWQVNPSEHETSAVPAYVINAIVALFAFHEAADIPRHHPWQGDSAFATFLAATSATWAKATGKVNRLTARSNSTFV